MRVDIYSVICFVWGYFDFVYWVYICFYSQLCLKIIDRNLIYNDQVFNVFFLCAGIKCYLDIKMINKRFIQYIKIYYSLVFVFDILQIDFDLWNFFDVLICLLIICVRYDLQQLYIGNWFIII